MKKSYLLIAFSLFTCILLLNSCDKKIGRLATEPVNASNIPPGCDTVTYTEDIKTIVDMKCGTATGCHVANQFASGGVSLTTYAQVKAKVDDNMIKVKVFDEGSMPKSPVTLTPTEKSLLLCWLLNGGKE